MIPDGDELDSAGPIVPAGVHLAPIWRRAIGLLIDQLVVVVPLLAVFVLTGSDADDTVRGGGWFGVLAVVIELVYGTVGVAVWGRTLGKVAMGTRVVHAVDGGRVGWGSALIRALVPASFGAIPVVGPVLGLGVYLLALFDPRRQGVHDKAAGTLVGMVH